MYTILKYSYDQAKKLGVQIQPSKHKYKKIDVYKDGSFICSIGDSRYLDYPNFLKIDKALGEKKEWPIINAIRKKMLKVQGAGMH